MDRRVISRYPREVQTRISNTARRTIISTSLWAKQEGHRTPLHRDTMGGHRDTMGEDRDTTGEDRDTMADWAGNLARNWRRKSGSAPGS